MMKFVRKLCSLLLVIMMVMTVCPVTALAAEPSNAVSVDAVNDFVRVAVSAKGKTKEALGLKGEWCAFFVGYCINHSKIKDKLGTIPSSYDLNGREIGGWIAKVKNAGTVYCASQAHINRWLEVHPDLSIQKINKSTFIPKPGDIIEFSWEDWSEHVWSHVAIVVSVDKANRQVTYIDGNSNSDGGNNGANVAQHTRSMDMSSIIGYVRFNTSSTSAPTTYTVSYNANGGSGAPSAQTKTKDVSLTLSTTRPTREGYSFLGWATSASAASAQYQPGSTYTANANVTLYAVWEVKTYAVRYDANGGTGAPATQNKVHDKALTLSSVVPRYDGYVFKGWCDLTPIAGAWVETKPTSGVYDTSYLYYCYGYEYNNDMTFWYGADKSKVEVLVKNNLPSGTSYNAEKLRYITYISSANVGSSFKPANGGTFTANYTNSDGSTGTTLIKNTEMFYKAPVYKQDSVSAVTYQPGDAYIANREVTFVAKWEEAPATYTVTYRSNTGDVSVCTNIPDTKEYSLDSIVTLSEKIPTRPNGKFMYWQEANTNKLYQPGDTVTIKGNMELVAIWALDWSHEKNGLFVGIDCVSVTPGETVDIPVFINYESRAVLSLEGEYSSFEYETETGGPLPKFVRYIPKEKPEKTMPGCYVIGIARYDIPKDLNLAGKYYFHLDNISDLTILDENGPLVVIRNNVYPASGEQAKARNGWTLNTPEATTFTVRFNANGGYGSMAAVSNVSGPYTLPSCTFEAPSGKQFKGWAVSPNGNVITGNSYNITADTTFYAVWEQQEVTGCCLEVGKMVATHGKEVLVPISISQNPGFAGINVKIDYDKTRLQFIGSGDIAGLDWTVNTGDNAGAVMVSTKNYTKNGEILLLKFKVLEDAPDGFAKVSLFNVDVLTIDEKPISVTVSSGGVEVITRLPGDVTGDGVIDTRDALRLKKHLAGMDAPIVWQNANVTGDNDVTLADLLRLMKYLAGMQVELV